MILFFITPEFLYAQWPVNVTDRHNDNWPSKCTLFEPEFYKTNAFRPMPPITIPPNILSPNLILKFCTHNIRADTFGRKPITDNKSTILLKDIYIDVYIVIKAIFYPIGGDDCCGYFSLSCTKWMSAFLSCAPSLYFIQLELDSLLYNLAL